MDTAVDRSQFHHAERAVGSESDSYRDSVKIRSVKSHDSSSDFIMTIEGYASTKEVDTYNEIIEPSAWTAGMPKFMRNPVLMANHSWNHFPIGKHIGYKVDDYGLFVTAVIARTPMGIEAAQLVELGILNMFSVGFTLPNFPKGYTYGKDGQPSIITDALIHENSIVNAGANPEAFFTEVEEKGIKLKYLVPQGIGHSRGRKLFMGTDIITKSDVESAVDEKVASVRASAEKTASTVEELGRSVDVVVKLQKTLQATAADQTKSLAEKFEVVDKMAEDFTAAVKDLEDVKAKITQRKSAGLFADDPSSNLNMKKLMSYEPARLKAMFAGAPSKAAQVEEFQTLNDDIMLCDALLQAASMNSGGAYHETNRAERIKGLSLFGELTEFAKAMDSTTAGEGDEFVPTVYSGKLNELLKLELRVAPLFDEITMPGDPFVLPIDGAETYATLAGQKKTVVSGFETTEQTPGTDNLTMTSAKARSRIQTSTELTEDSIIAIMPFISKAAVKGIARSIDRSIINGQKTATIDTDLTIAADDFRKAYDGLRYHVQNSIGGTRVDLGTWSEENVRLIRAGMGKYGLLPSDLVQLCSVKTYLRKYVGSAFESMNTIDKYGPKAVVLTGELLKQDNMPVVVTEFMTDDLDENGVNATGAANTDRSELLFVHRASYLRGVRRQIETAVARDWDNDVYQVFAYKRVAFLPVPTPSSSHVTVESGVNITY